MKTVSWQKKKSQRLVSLSLSLPLSLSFQISLFLFSFSSFYSIACCMTRFDKIKRLCGRLFLIAPTENIEGTPSDFASWRKEALSRHRLCAAPFAPRSHERTLEWSCASTRREALFNSLSDREREREREREIFSTAIENHRLFHCVSKNFRSVENSLIIGRR